MRDVAERLTERLYQSITTSVQGVPATVDPTKGGESCHSCEGRAHYQPLRNSASFRVGLSDLFFLEFPNRASKAMRDVLRAFGPFCVYLYQKTA